MSRWSTCPLPFSPQLPGRHSFEHGLLLHHIKFFYESVPTNFIPFTVISVCYCQPGMTGSASCLAKIILALTIYFGERFACRSFAPGKMAEYRKIQQNNYVLCHVVLQEPSKFSFPEVICFYLLEWYVDIFIKYTFIKYKIFGTISFPLTTIFSVLETC